MKKKQLDKNQILYEIVIENALITKKARAGNFVLVRINEQGERIPLTIADYDRIEGTITLVFQVVGKTTKLMSNLKVGDAILDVIGPLGKSIPIEKFEHPIVIIGGGVGIAPCYPQAKELKEAGNKIISIIGARTKDLLFWVDKMRAVSDEIIVCTDDGSEGRKGLVTEPLKELLKKVKLSLVIAIGPLIMMKFASLTTNGSSGLPKVKTMVSLNPIMVDGTGMCGGCRFSTVDGKFFFACVDGPDFDGHIIDFDNLMKRAKRFEKDENKSLEIFNHQCKLLGEIN